MSYSSENVLAKTANIDHVRDLVRLLGYKKGAVLRFRGEGPFEEYWWFDATDYKSWSGVELAIYRDEAAQLVVSTRSVASRSLFDLAHQNRTISFLRRHFGGTFTTDEGRGRYMRFDSTPPPPAASGCFLAFSRFGGNLIKAHLCHTSRSFPARYPKPSKRLGFLNDYDPRVIANNTLMPFVVAASEDYFKSTFIALLRYSPRREAFLKGFRLQGDQLSAIAAGGLSVEEQIAETLPFQNISAVCRHFSSLDPSLDLAGALRKPYRRRKLSLFDSIEALVVSRHDLIHRALIDTTLDDYRVDEILRDVEAATTRVYKKITDHYGWFYEKTWGVGHRRPRKLPSSDAT
jgi:hypothetical protein